MENNLLVVDSENQTMMSRMEGMVSQLVVDSRTSQANSAVSNKLFYPRGVVPDKVLCSSLIAPIQMP